MDLPLPAPSRDPVADRAAERARLLRGLVVSAALTALLWWIAWFQHAWGWDFSGLTLRPGSARGLIGILSAPLLHGSLAHLVANTLPLLLLGTLAVATLPRASLRALPWIWLLSGFGTWLIGRESAHLGASGLTHGLMFFVLTAGIVRRDRAAIAAALLAFFFYGGMLLSVLPRDPGISWEYHLCGAVAGVLAALFWSRLDPLPPRKRYSWDDEDESLQPAEDELELPSPGAVPVLWHRHDGADERGVVLQFPPRGRDAGVTAAHAGDEDESTQR
ncbi:MAG: rhomboid family intramembrane serine protease [Xanthomonadales bacterium]|nr:rhomboid family intramembrane serine protease [Xanthomonadales bacterium]